MASVNKILLLGNLTRNPELKYLPNQTAVVDFGLAMNRKWTAQDGSARDEACFVDCRAFAKAAENINKYFTKGKPIFIEGHLAFDQWTGQDGVKHSKHRVIVQTFTFLPNSNWEDDRGGDELAAAGVGAKGAGPSQDPSPDSDIPF
jgi:single-strand DNA-binding protein